MLNRKKRELRIVNMVLKKVYPVRANQYIDLWAAKEHLCFDGVKKFCGCISYEPEIVRNVMQVEFCDLKFRVFSNGSVVVVGIKDINRLKKIESIIDLFWNFYLKNFVKLKEVEKS